MIFYKDDRLVVGKLLRFISKLYFILVTTISNPKSNTERMQQNASIKKAGAVSSTVTLTGSLAPPSEHFGCFAYHIDF